MEGPVGVSPLSRPISLGGVAVRNRLFMAPLTTNYGDERGAVTEKTLGFYEERARGGDPAAVASCFSG